MINNSIFKLNSHPQPGLIDPWHVLSVLGGEEGEDEETIVIPGASHCQDMRDARPTDPAVLKQAREVSRVGVERMMYVSGLKTVQFEVRISPEVDL